MTRLGSRPTSGSGELKNETEAEPDDLSYLVAVMIAGTEKAPEEVERLRDRATESTQQAVDQFAGTLARVDSMPLMAAKNQAARSANRSLWRLRRLGLQECFHAAALRLLAASITPALV